MFPFLIAFAFALALALAFFATNAASADHMLYCDHMHQVQARSAIVPCRPSESIGTGISAHYGVRAYNPAEVIVPRCNK